MSEFDNDEFSPLHVYRHNFKPSVELENGLMEFIEPDSKSGLLLHSTKEAYVSSLDYSLNLYTQEERKAVEDTKSVGRVTFEIARIAVKMLKYRTGFEGSDHPDNLQGLRVSLLPRETSAFNSLASSLDIFPDIFPHPEPNNHYLFIDFPKRITRSEAVVSSQADRLNSEMGRKALSGLFSATLVGLGGSETVRPTSRLRPGWRNLS